MLTVILSLFLVGGFQSAGQDTLTLEYCYFRIENNYPIARKVELDNKIAELNKKIAHTSYYPQINFGATASYQSEVTELQFPTGGRAAGPELSRDQYKISMDVSQNLYNSGAVSIKKKMEEARGERDQQSTQVELHQLKEQVNSVYFGILLAQRQMEVVKTLAKDVRVRIKNVRSKVRQGVLLPSQQYILQAELKNILQDSTEIQNNIIAGYQMLGQIIGRDIAIEEKLKLPQIAHNADIENSTLPQLRPEYDLFESNRKLLEHRKELAETSKIPSVSLFGTAAYGRPGFNVFENNMHPFYIAGIKLQWNMWGAINADKKQEIYSLQQKRITEEEHAFSRQLNGRRAEIYRRIISLKKQIARDKEIINLREKVVSTIASQMENGTATATEYITELNKATQARLSRQMNQIRLAQARINYQTLLGYQIK